MKAVINQGTDKELSWHIDDQITPQLVEEIRRAGVTKEIDWKSSPLFDLLVLIMESNDKEEIIERLFDEDEEIITLIGAELDINNLDSSIDKNQLQELARLYLPVLIIMIDLL